jgi:hypothetical protein
MYCPRCSHEQGLEDQRFCPRCGFSLAGVAMLLETPEITSQPPSHPTQAPKQRNCIIKESLILTLLAWAIGLVLSFMWNVGGQFESIAKVGSLVFFLLGFVGLLRFLIAFLFVKDTIHLPPQASFRRASYIRSVSESPTRSVLPPAQSVTVSDYSPRTNTREIVARPSVTEHTTRLLEDPNN